MSTDQTPLTTPPRPGHYWQQEASGEWRQVRPINWFWLAQYAARIKREGNDNANG